MSEQNSFAYVYRKQKRQKEMIRRRYCGTGNRSFLASRVTKPEFRYEGQRKEEILCRRM